MNLTDQDIDDLRTAIHSAPPAFYKDNYHFASYSRGVIRFLRRNGVSVELERDTGRISVDR